MSTKLIKKRVLCWRTWMHGLFGAAIGGGASALSVCVVDPKAFNFGEGIGSLLKVFAASAIISAALYLSKSPVPEIKDVED